MAIFNSYVSLPEGILQIMECMEWTYYMSMCASQNMFFSSTSHRVEISKVSHHVQLPAKVLFKNEIPWYPHDTLCNTALEAMAHFFRW